MSLTELPDVCLLRLFNNLPVSDLLHRIPLVCHRWHSLQPAALKQRRSLSLFIGSDPLHLVHRSSFVTPFRVDQLDSKLIPYRHSSENRLNFADSLERDTIQRIEDTFPNVSHLEIAQRDVHYSALDETVLLVQFYARKLVQLKLWISYADEANITTNRLISDKLINLIIVINHELPNLTKLTFYCRHQVILPGYTKGRLDLPILGQLESIQWFTFDGAEELFGTLLEHGQPNARLNNIELQNLINNHALERMVTQFDESFASKFKNLDISFSSISAIQLEHFCELFTDLTTVYIYVESVSIGQFAKCLVNLPALTHLRMDVNFEFYRPNRSNEENFKSTLTRLPQIEILSLRVISTSHADLSALHPEWLFPNLLVVQIVNLNEHCSAEGCGYAYPEITNEQRKECTKKLVTPFALCPRLRKVCALKGFVTDDQLEWDVSEL